LLRLVDTSAFWALVRDQDVMRAWQHLGAERLFPRLRAFHCFAGGDIYEWAAEPEQ
jgi:hypothetical protein